MNSTIYNTLPELLKANIKQISKKSDETAGSRPNGGGTVTTSDNLFILSYTELVKNSTGSKYWDDASHDGSVYQFWSNKNLEINISSRPSSTQQQLLYKFNCDRRGTLLNGSAQSLPGYTWLRSVDPYDSAKVLTFNSNGWVNDFNGYDPNYLHCVSPSFAM